MDRVLDIGDSTEAGDRVGRPRMRLLLRAAVGTISGALIAGGVALSVGVVYFGVALDLQSAFQWFGLTSIALISAMLVMPMQKAGPGFIVMLYTIISHFGLPLIYVLTSSQEVIDDALSNRHIYGTFVPSALSVSYLACASFLLGWRIARTRRSSVIAKEVIEDSEKDGRRAEVLATCVTLSLVAIYAYAVVLGGFVLGGGLLAAQYSEVKAAFGESSLIAHLQRLFWIACVVIGGIGGRRSIVAAAPAVLLISGLLLLSGNRNDILYPLAASLGMYAYRRRRVPKMAVLVGVLVLFVLSPWISEVRSSGWGGRIFEWRFVESVSEMGAQIAPFTIAMSWVGPHIPWMAGVTLLWPSAVVLTGSLWGSGSYGDSLFYLPNLLALSGQYGLGFSMVAEMWVNFGTWGAIVVYAILGLSMGSIENRSLAGGKLLMYGAFSLLMTYWVRNSLQYNVLIVVYAAGMYLLASAITGSKGHREPRETQGLYEGVVE